MIPTFILTMWLLGLLAATIFGSAIYLAHEWYVRSWRWDELLHQSVFAPDFGWNEPTLLLVGAGALMLIALMGGPVLKALLRLSKRSETDDPRMGLPPAAQRRIQRPDGSELQVTTYGSVDAPALVLTHGWGLNSDEWVYAYRELVRHFRLIVWDQPGLGSSKAPANSDFSLEKLARDLEAVIESSGSVPVTLVGHSIGGMIILTYCRLFPEALRSRVAGLVLTHTTYTNPVRTTRGAAFLSAIEKPVLVPLLYLTIALWPLVWLMNWFSYLNGSAHLMNMSTSFAGTESWQQIDFAARFQVRASPRVLARGMLGMMNYDATATLPRISVPALVISGDRDTTCLPEASDVMRQQIPKANEVRLKPARHLGLLEHHARYAEAVRTFADAAVKTQAAAPAIA